jgi:CRP/FNR family transcriptional regulator
MSRPSGAPPATNDPASPSCTTLDCLHCSVRHLAVCSALSPDEVQALEQVTVSQQVGRAARWPAPAKSATSMSYIDRRRTAPGSHPADGRRQINGFVLPGDYLA